MNAFGLEVRQTAALTLMLALFYPAISFAQEGAEVKMGEVTAGAPQLTGTREAPEAETGKLQRCRGMLQSR